MRLPEKLQRWNRTLNMKTFKKDPELTFRFSLKCYLCAKPLTQKLLCYPISVSTLAEFLFMSLAIPMIASPTIPLNRNCAH